MKKNIFITGISGCIGHYLFDVLKDNPDNELYLLVREPRRLRFDPASQPNVHVIEDTFSNIDAHVDLLSRMDDVVHILTAWSGPSVELINLDKTLFLFTHLNPNRIQKVIYFSTASVLGPDGRPDPKALQFGTSYVETKYRAYQAIRQLPLSDKIITLFPTLVMGGDKRHPYSHITSGVNMAHRYRWLLRWFSINMHFNYLHSYDIALVVKYLLEHDMEGRDFVLGNPPVSADEVIDTLFERLTPRRWTLDITGLFQSVVPHLVKLHPWSRYCIERKDFVYDAVCPATFGIASPYMHLAKSLEY